MVYYSRKGYVAIRRAEVETKLLFDIYENLLAYFGPRHWWPAETKFEVIVGAILTQNVAWRNVEQAISNLKAHDMLHLDKIITADLEFLGQLIRPTRYYRVKARKLQEFFNYIAKVYHGDITAIFRGKLRDIREELLELYGIGPETADTILLYAGELPIFVVDAYTRRIFFRLGLFPEDVTYQEMQDFFMDRLPHEVSLFNEYHALIDALGNRICLARKPKCDICPVGQYCKFNYK